MIRNAMSCFLVVAICISCAAVKAPDDSSPRSWFPTPSNTKPRPDYFNHAYGPHERNVLDLWQAESEKPTPVLIFFHGGGFVGGDKWTLSSDLLQMCLNSGISVASANYRKSTQAPYPAPMLDGARAVQYLRYRAKDWNLDPDRIAVSGDSAGAGISLWIAFHDDLRRPGSHDKVLRESSRVSAACVFGAQSTYDPRVIRNEIGGRSYEHPALTMFYGITLEELDTPKAYRLYEDASAINHATPDDPPVIMFYSEDRAPLPPGPNPNAGLYYPDFGKPLEGYGPPGEAIHHPRFGALLEEKLEPMGIECILLHRDDFSATENPGAAAHHEMVQFLRRLFKMMEEE
ncbi:MAG: alpha/beta hydrolase [Candidatus Hydrogenedentes bacterium]|nr:alpha/beta hydrolase [Candidatus Hydrogenedentota bacterium]